MEKRARRKKQILRRATAFLLSLVMILSMVYINGRESVSEADPLPAVTPYDDTTFLDGYSAEFLTGTITQYTVYSPSDAVSFVLPSVDATNGYGWYKEGEVPTASGLDITAGTAVTKLSTAAGADVASTAVLCKVTEGIPAADPDPQVDATVQEITKVTLSVQAPTDVSAAVTDATATVSVTTDSTYSTTSSGANLIYGSVSVAYEKSETAKDYDQVTGWTTDVSSVNTALSANTDTADGSYVVYQAVLLPKEGGDVCAHFSNCTAVRDFYISLGTVSATASGSSIGTYDAENKTLTIENAKPGADITVSVNTAENVTGTYSVTTTTEAAHASAPTTAKVGDVYTTTVVIAGGSVNSGKTNLSRTITLQSGTKTAETISLSISYLTPGATVSNSRITDNGTEITNKYDATTYYVNSQNYYVQLKADVEPASGFALDSASLYRGTDTTALSTHSFSGNPTAKTTAEFEINKSSLPTGLSTYKIAPKVVGEDQLPKQDVCGIFYDPTAPTIGSMKLQQGGNTKSLPDSTPVDSVTPSKAVTFLIPAEDETGGSGMDFVTVKDQTTNNEYPSSSTETIDSVEYYKVTVPSDNFETLKGNGGTRTFEIKATDAAGNVSTGKYPTINFSKDDITIESKIEDVKFEKGDTVYSNELSVTITYTVKTDVKLKSAKLNMKQDGTAAPEETLTLPTPTQEDGAYKYTISKQLTTSVSTEFTEIRLDLETNATVKISHDSGILGFDITDPQVDYADKDGVFSIDDLITDQTWLRDLSIIFTFRDKTKDEDPSAPASAGKFQTGFDKDSLLVEAESKGFNKAAAEIAVDGDGKSGTLTVNINESKSATTGTSVKVVIQDKAGNQYIFPESTFYIDKTPPVPTIKVEGSAKSDLSYHGDPKVSYSIKEELGIAETKLDIKRGGVSVGTVYSTDKTMADKKLSELLGSKPQDGKYEITLSVADNPVGDVDAPLHGYLPVETTISFTLDNEAPVPDLEIQNIDVYKNPVTYSNQDSGLTYEYDKYTKNSPVRITCSVKGDDVAYIDVMDQGITKLRKKDFSSKNKATLIVEGDFEHDITIKAIDNAGNVSKIRRVKFTIDQTAPELVTTLDGPAYDPNKSYYQNEDTVVGIAYSKSEQNIDPEGLIQGLKYTPFNQPEQPEESAVIKPGSYTFSKNGNYVLTYTATDLAGNSSKKVVKFTLDKISPRTDILFANPEDAPKFEKYHSTYTNKVTGTTYNYATYFNKSVNLKFEVEDPTISSVSVKDAVNGGTPKEILVLSNFNMEMGKKIATAKIEGQGTHVVTINAKDRCGNVAATRKVTFVIDTDRPSVSTSLNGVPFPNGGATRYLNVNGSVAVSVSDVNKDETDLTRTMKTTPPGSSTSTSSAKMPEGAESYTGEADYEVTYVAVDRAGNASSPVTLSFRVDKTAPQLRISGAADGGTSTTSVTASYNVIEAFYADMVSAVVKVYQKNDGTSEKLLRQVDFKATGQNSTMSELFREDGEYRFEFDAEDKAGNKAHTVYSFIVDATAPTIVLSGVKNYEKTKTDVDLDVLVKENFYLTNKLNIDGTKVDIEGKKSDLKVDSINANSGREVTISQHYKDDGVYDVNVVSKDRAGNEAKQNVHFTIDKTAPVIGDLSAYDGTVLNKFVWDIDEDKLVTDLTPCKVTIYLDGMEYDGVSELSDGSHVLRVTAVDELGNESSKEVTFQLDQIAPNIIISGIEDKQTIEEPVEIKVALQLDEDTLDDVKLNDKLQLLSGNTSTFKVDAAGDYKLVIRAHDKAGNKSEVEWTFTYGSKFNWWWIVAIGGGLLLLLLIILLIRKRSWSQKK